MEFNNIKDKVLSTLGQATDSVKGLAGSATDKAKAGARIAKLSMEAATAREELKKSYLEIGRLYYDAHKDDPEGFFVQLFEEVRIAEADIAAKEAEIAELKDTLRDGFSNVTVEITKDEDFSDVVDQTEAAVEEVQEAAEEIKEAVEEFKEDQD